MYRRYLWCYVFILTLLDISLNTKLTAQGKSHGVTVQDSLIEGVTFQEWDKESTGESAGSEEGEGGGAGGVRLRPATLRFGRAALAVAHARAVTLTNAANTTLHLASVAGTTPDFHASFFEAKTLPPQGNTTFSVVYLGRREGPVSAHLYIHTSLGVHKYPVSAVGVASEYDVWPLVGVRVPANATVEPELTLYNPTDQTIQVSEVYSSGAWLGLRLPGGGASAPRDLWAVPPRTARPLVRLRMAPPKPAAATAADQHHPLTAYIRIKANIPGGGLVLAVEARGAAAGEHARPLQLRLRARGSLDPPHTMEVEVANSAGAPVRLHAELRAAHCAGAHDAHAAHAALAPPGEPCAAADPPAPDHTNGGGPVGAHVKLLQSQLDAYQDFTKVAQLTLNYAELWAGAVEAGVTSAAAGEGGEAGEAGEGGEAWCAGCVRLGRAALPYSVRLLPGRLQLLPDSLQLVRSAGTAALRAREVTARNQFRVPVRVSAVSIPLHAAPYFRVEDMSPLTLRAGESAVVARIALLERALLDEYTLDSHVTLRTNLSDYSLPLMVYSGRFEFEWEWPEWSAAGVELGTLSAGSTLRLAARLRNAGPAPLCALQLSAALPPAAPAAPAPAPAADFYVDPDAAAQANGSAVCAEGGSFVGAWLALSVPPAAGAWRGELAVRSQHARSLTAFSLRALPGRLAPRPLALPPAAPYVWSSAELVVDNSMGVRMGIVSVAAAGGPAGALADEGAEGEGAGAEGAALRWRRAADAVEAGTSALGTLTLAPERACRPHCYTGLDIDTPEGAAWVQRCAESAGGLGGGALAADAALLAERLAAFERSAAAPANFTLLLRTTEVVSSSWSGWARARWVRLAGAGAGRAGAAAAGGAAALRLLLRNPAAAPLLLHAALHAGPPLRAHRLPPRAGGDSAFCERERCEWAPEAFSLGEWRVTRGRAAPWLPPAPAGVAPAPPPPANASSLPPLLLQPDAEVELKIVFAPPRAASLTTYLYLRNNLTILEGVQLWGQGAVASFEIGGRRPGSTSPISFEVSGCGAEAGAAVVRLAVGVRNTGRVAVRLRDWLVAGRPCAARGFRLQPCAPLHLAPNDSRTLHLSYAADYTLARAHASLRLRSELGIAEFTLAASTPTKLLWKCAADARPPWEYSVRAGAWILSVAAFCIVLVAGVVDAERMMRHLHASRSVSPPARPPLDLRSLAAEPPAPPPALASRAPPPPRRRRPARRAAPPLDALAERRAFERWRAEMLRGADDEDDRSSEDASPPPLAPHAPLDDPKRPRLAADAPPVDPRPESPSPPPDEFETDVCAPRSSEDDSASTGSDASTPADERDETEVEPDDAETEATTREPSPARVEDEPIREPPIRRERLAPAAGTPARHARPRRDRTESLRRAERGRADSESAPARGGPAAIKSHGRRDKNSKRRAPAPPTPSRSSPGAPPAEGSAESGAGGAAAGEAEGGPRGSVRWGASWSSVVGGGAALAPIGSDVRRREPERPVHDNSLFYFNGDAPHVAASALASDADFPWATAAPDRSAFAPGPHDATFVPGNHDSAFAPAKLDSAFAPGKHDSAFGASKHDPAFGATVHDSAFATGTHDTAFAPGTHDFLTDKGGLSGDAFGGLGSVWSGAGGVGSVGGVSGVGGAWTWSSFGGAPAPLRPPPGFGAPRSPVRPYDPFRSLASIWAPGAADWRPAAPAPAPSPADARAPRPDRADRPERSADK